MAKPLNEQVHLLTGSSSDDGKDILLAPLTGPQRSDKWWNFGDSFYTRWLELSPNARFVVAGAAVAGAVGLLSLAASSRTATPAAVS
ncbi:MAG TPA: hypothetical protein VKD71_02830 [Gemmataceae bacterium]|nr:hypothetical protein [Gemmataceae bacterium]